MFPGWKMCWQPQCSLQESALQQQCNQCHAAEYSRQHPDRQLFYIRGWWLSIRCSSLTPATAASTTSHVGTCCVCSRCWHGKLLVLLHIIKSAVQPSRRCSIRRVRDAGCKGDEGSEVVLESTLARWEGRGGDAAGVGRQRKGSCTGLAALLVVSIDDIRPQH